MQSVDQNGFTQKQVEFFMKKALQQASKAFENGQVPVGCVFVTRTQQNKQWRVVASSHNLTNKYKNATRHCQINCIHQMQEKISQQQRQNLYLFVSVQPCIMCTYALNIIKVKFVYFGQFNDKFGGCGSVMKRNNFPFKGGLLQNESYQLIKTFYERGNQRLNQEMRNRKRKKIKSENQNLIDLNQKEDKGTQKN